MIATALRIDQLLGLRRRPKRVESPEAWVLGKEGDVPDDWERSADGVAACQPPNSSRCPWLRSSETHVGVGHQGVRPLDSPTTPTRRHGDRTGDCDCDEGTRWTTGAPPPGDDVSSNSAASW